jgi:serine/threonine protein kinase
MGAGACPHDGCLAGDAAHSSTQTLPPPGPLAPDPPRADPQRTPEPAPPGVLPGQRLGDYVVRRYVGSGGMGVVYEAEHVAIGRKVAIKLIREERLRGPHARGLLEEARAASAIRHHGIIDIHGFGQQPGVGQYLVMEYLEGRSLDEIMQRRVPMGLSGALPLLCEVLDALSAAHAAGVIHRDLKPSNIFVVRQSDGSEHVKVLDFGLAKVADVPHGHIAQSHPSLVVGTPRYMAPEQALGQEVGPRTDLYAVGVIAFELLTGQRLFPGASHMEVLFHHLKSSPPVPSSLAPLPPELDALILRLLAKAPQQRPDSASEVARALRALLPPGEAPRAQPRRLSQEVEGSHRSVDSAGTGGSAPPASAPVPVGAARWKWPGVVGGLLVLCLAAGAETWLCGAPPATVVVSRPLGGQVLDAEGRPLAGARVTLLQSRSDASVETMTNTRGLFHLELRSAREQEVRFRVELAGYVPYESTATPGNTGLSFSMERDEAARDLPVGGPGP